MAGAETNRTSLEHEVTIGDCLVVVQGVSTVRWTRSSEKQRPLSVMSLLSSAGFSLSIKQPSW